MDQVVQVAGALLILAGYGAALTGRMSPHSLAYLMLNLVGSAVLCVLAFADYEWGFVLLEGAWALISAYGLIALARGRVPSAPATH
jgi:hypothetical protein